MIGYVVKYALTRGVLKVTGEQEEIRGKTHFRLLSYIPRLPYCSPGEFSVKPEEAETLVRQQIEAAIEKAEKELRKLRALDPTKMVAEAKLIS